MAYYQNSTTDSTKLILGNYKIEYAASAAASYINLGAGQVNSFAHDISMYDIQAGNAPDPIEGISDETFTVVFDLIEYDASSLAAISGGAMTASSSTVLSTLTVGGQTTITPKAFKFTNTRVVSGATKETVITVYKATMNAGMQITAKSDNDTDPINIIPITILGKVDSTRTVGNQLFSITKSLWT
jgi:hypothetical protein